jgi:hypothetical protein
MPSNMLPQAILNRTIAAYRATQKALTGPIVQTVPGALDVATHSLNQVKRDLTYLQATQTGRSWRRQAERAVLGDQLNVQATRIAHELTDVRNTRLGANTGVVSGKISVDPNQNFVLSALSAHKKERQTNHLSHLLGRSQTTTPKCINELGYNSITTAVPNYDQLRADTSFTRTSLKMQQDALGRLLTDKTRLATEHQSLVTAIPRATATLNEATQKLQQLTKKNWLAFSWDKSDRLFAVRKAKRELTKQIAELSTAIEQQTAGLITNQASQQHNMAILDLAYTNLDKCQTSYQAAKASLEKTVKEHMLANAAKIKVKNPNFTYTPPAETLSERQQHLDRQRAIGAAKGVPEPIDNNVTL